VAETRPKDSPSLRKPKAKKPLGLSVPPALRMPHETLIQAESTLPSQTTTTSHTSEARHTPAAPVRDFHKVANSIAREAVPAGLFTGKSKQLYDCLYALTRGAIVPARTVRISRPKLMKRAGIGARVTFEANVDRLTAVGLIRVRQIAGEHEGNEYTVFTPDEVSMPSQTSVTSPALKVDGLDGLESSQTSHTLNTDFQRTSEDSKTLIKTSKQNTDDEAAPASKPQFENFEVFANAIAAIDTASKELTGKGINPAEASKWSEVFEVLTTELKIAAGRTTVSSVPAFLAEHLRRRLWKKDKRQIAEEGKAEIPHSAIRVDASKCPDCFGTGMRYVNPETFEGGVVRCRHEGLQSAHP